MAGLHRGRYMSALQRKAQAGRQEHQSRAMSVAKALRLSMAKVADELFDMAISVIGVTQELHSSSTLEKALDETSLMVFLDGPKGRPGAATLCLNLVSALIQQQTTGRIAVQEPAARAMTSTDAALCAPLLDALIARASGIVEDENDHTLLSGYRYGACADGPRLLAMALEAPEYCVVRLTLDIAAGAHQGSLVFVLERPEAKPVQNEHVHESAVLSTASLDTAVQGLPAELAVVLCTLRMPASKLGTLSIGDQIPLPPDAFPEACVTTKNNQRLATGILGQVNGMRVLRISDPLPAGIPRGPTAHTDDVLDLEAVTPAFEDPPIVEVMEPVVNLPELDAPLDLPNMDDLPELSGLPDLPEIEMPSDSTGTLDLPELGALPELPKLEI